MKYALNLLLLCVLSLSLALVGCEVDGDADATTTDTRMTTSSSGGAQMATVTLTPSGANPVATTVGVGGTVTFTNSRDFDAALVFSDGSMLNIAAGASGMKTFSNAGMFTFLDNNDTGTQGQITVQ